MTSEPRIVCAHATEPCPFCRAAVAAPTHEARIRELATRLGRDAILVFMASLELPKAA